MSVDLLASRAQLYALLEAAGIQHDPGGGVRLAGIPGVVVRPSTQWLQPVNLRRGLHRISWDLMAVGGRQDSAAAFRELAELIVRVWSALAPLAGSWSSPGFAGPLVYAQDGVDHLAAVATMTTHVDLGGVT